MSEDSRLAREGNQVDKKRWSWCVMMKLISSSWIMMNLISKKDLRKEKKKVIQKRNLIDTPCESNINTFIWKKNVGLTHFLAPSLKIFPKKFLAFLPKKTHSQKISYIFSKKSFSYISGNGTFWHQDWKLSYIFSKHFFLIFQETELSSLKFKNFQEPLWAWKIKKLT